MPKPNADAWPCCSIIWFAILAVKAQRLLVIYQDHCSPVKGQLLAEHEEQLPGAVQVHTGPSGLDTVLLHAASGCQQRNLLLIRALWGSLPILATVYVSLLFSMELDLGLIAASGSQIN